MTGSVILLCITLLAASVLVPGCDLAPQGVVPERSPGAASPVEPERGARTDSDADPQSPPESPESLILAEEVRPPDQRPRHDAERLETLGIRLFESRRLKLYTDVSDADVNKLPQQLDQLHDDWESYFGPLPPARDKSDYQLTGYLMRDQQPFREAGLLPARLAVFAHGKHGGQEFWINEQDSDYYRSHLLFHEATHCFMQSMGGTTVDVPVWYLEGMAELFATHQVQRDGQVRFGDVPQAADEYIGLGRVEMIARDVEQRRAMSLKEVMSLSPRQYQERPSAYAWSWATCLLADRHPGYRDLFRELGRRYPRSGFGPVWSELFGPVMPEFAVEWELLVRAFDYGHDFSSLAIEFEPGTLLTQDGEREVTIEANRGWQSTGVRVLPEQPTTVTTSGRVSLADEPRPWRSGPDGVTIRYAHGHPIGRLLGVIIGDRPHSGDEERYLSESIVIGKRSTLTTEQPGTLYLRVNDFDDEVADNRGEFSVRIFSTESEADRGN